MDNENEIREKLIGILSICRKAGRIKLGFDATKDAMTRKMAKAVLICEDLSPKSEKEVRFFAEKSQVKVLKMSLKQDEVYFGLGKKVGIVAVCDDGFAKAAEDIIINL